MGHKPGPDKIKIEFDHMPLPFSGVAVSGVFTIVDRNIQYSTPANLCLYRIAFTRLVI